MASKFALFMLFCVILVFSSFGIPLPPDYRDPSRGEADDVITFPPGWPGFNGTEEPKKLDQNRPKDMEIAKKDDPPVVSVAVTPLDRVKIAFEILGGIIGLGFAISALIVAFKRYQGDNNGAWGQNLAQFLITVFQFIQERRQRR